MLYNLFAGCHGWPVWICRPLYKTEVYDQEMRQLIATTYAQHEHLSSYQENITDVQAIKLKNKNNYLYIDLHPCQNMCSIWLDEYEHYLHRMRASGPCINACIYVCLWSAHVLPINVFS